MLSLNEISHQAFLKGFAFRIVNGKIGMTILEIDMPDILTHVSFLPGGKVLLQWPGFYNRLIEVPLRPNDAKVQLKHLKDVRSLRVQLEATSIRPQMWIRDWPSTWRRVLTAHDVAPGGDNA